MTQSDLDAAMSGVGPTKSWQDAHKECLQVVLTQAQHIEALEALHEPSMAKELEELITEYETAKKEFAAVFDSSFTPRAASDFSAADKNFTTAERNLATYVYAHRAAVLAALRGGEVKKP